MEFFTKEKDGTVIIREFVGTGSFPNEALSTFTEAKSANSKSKLIQTIAGIHEGVTRNLTEYMRDELEASIPTWTNPYRTPVLVNHDQGNVNATIGRVINVHMGEHNGAKALIFTSEITDAEAIQKISDERYYTVSIGSRVGSIKCSICGNDWSQSFCEHERGSYYLTDESDPGSAKQCTWQIGKMEGLEISYVPVPSDKNAMNISDDKKKSKKESLDDICEKLYMFNESGSIDRINKDGSMEHLGEDQNINDLVEEVEETEDEVVDTEADEDEDTAEEETSTEDDEEIVEEEEVVIEDEPADEEVVEDDEEEVVEDETEIEDEEEEVVEDEEEVVEDDEEEEVVVDQAEETINSLRKMLKDARVELLLALKGLETDSEEALEIVNRYESVDEQVLADIIKGERATRKAIGLAELRNSVDNPTLTEDPVDEPHNPSEKKSSVKVKVKGSSKTLEITPKDDGIKTVKVRR